MFYKTDFFRHLIMICHLNSIQFASEGSSFSSYKLQQYRLQGFFKNLSNAILKESLINLTNIPWLVSYTPCCQSELEKNQVSCKCEQHTTPYLLI